MSIVLSGFCLKLILNGSLKPGRPSVLMVLGLLLMLGLAAPVMAERALEPQFDGVEAPTGKDSPFDGGVKAYREGDYRQARKVFDGMHRQAPENTKVTYYLAITEAQLGRFQQSKILYNEIITLDPNGEAATLAKEGLSYLPPETSLDLPPRFNQPATGMSGGPKSTAQTLANGANNPGAGSNVLPIMPAQDLMAWQMLMGQNNGNNMGGNNPMGSFMPNMNMMMGNGNAPNNGAGGMSSFDPSMMSNMMMNQMMQNVNVGGDQNENR